MERKGTILLVEDNKSLNISNHRALKLRGYYVVVTATLAMARERLEEISPDVILLDVMMPDGNGFDFCSEIRKNTSAHILFLTAKTERESILHGLESGGDDYITKPFHPAELLARVDAAMRRRKIAGTAAETLVRGLLKLDIVAAQAFIDGENLSLTPKEFSLLLFFAKNEGQLVTAEQVYKTIWNVPLTKDKNALQTAVSKLRQKIEYAGFSIDSLRGRGYIFRDN